MLRRKGWKNIHQHVNSAYLLVLIQRAFILFIVLRILQIFYNKHVDKSYKNVPQNNTPSNPYWPSEGRLRVRARPGGTGRDGLWKTIPAWAPANCHAPVFRAPLQLGGRDLVLGPRGNTQVALSTSQVDTELV